MLRSLKLWLLTLSLGLATVQPLAQATEHQAANHTGRTIHVDLVVLEQQVFYNRLGAHLPNAQLYALRSDIVPKVAGHSLSPGQVKLRDDKRPRPIVLRANEGDKLVIKLQNLLPLPPSCEIIIKKKVSRVLCGAGVQIMGLQWDKLSPPDCPTGNIPCDNSQRIQPGQTATYRYVANAEGVFMLYSPNGQSIPNSQLDYGLFGAVNIQPREAEYYRSQVTRDDLIAATYKVSSNFLKYQVVLPGSESCGQFYTSDISGLPAGTGIRRKPVRDGSRLICPDAGPKVVYEFKVPTAENPDTAKISDVLITTEGRLNTLSHHPVVDYQAKDSNGKPILNMLKAREDDGFDLIHTDLNAIITGPEAGRFPYYLTGPSFRENPATPDRRQPYREFSVMYHIAVLTKQAFPAFDAGPLSNTLSYGADNFSINYGIGGIAAEILANRLHKGPMGINQDGVDLKFEEFFLSSWAVGDPAMVVDNPANGNVRATKAIYPDDPANVYHAYMRDHVKFRVMNAGSVAPHVHHQHAHQWLHTPNSDDSHYLDSQMINPGATYTLEMTYNGSGNRNQTVGDSIFHCHFYPHFAQGMWSLWRVHDVFEAGTELNDAGYPVPGARALPDGEIALGTPIPALVPLPTLAMAPLPAKVQLVNNGRQVKVLPESIDENGKPVFKNPGFPFFIPGVAGHRAPHPPMDFAWQENPDGTPKLYTAELAELWPFAEAGEPIFLDGGLPRHQVLGGKVVREFHTRWDFTKDTVAYDEEGNFIAGGMRAVELPEQGTPVEQVAMATHATRTHLSYQPDGRPGNFILNGLPPVPGAPYAAPDVDDNGNSNFDARRYKAAVIQTDVVLNKEGWHYPQQRFITLLDDVKPTLKGEKPPEPFFFRSNTGETIEFWHTNLVPDYYELDDFQVRTPTDILGQHIHLVKFDVTSSDGAGNGFNYEDGTFSPQEVQGRIDAINAYGGLYHYDPVTQGLSSQQTKLKVRDYTQDYPTLPKGKNKEWDGAQTTVQRFDTDPLLNNEGEDRTLRTVFTHDHFGPSTHQQVGLYGALLVEPDGSKWKDAVTGCAMPADGSPGCPQKRDDGGPTSWQAVIETRNPDESYREFAIATADLQLAYKKGSIAERKQPTTIWFTTPSKPHEREKDKKKCIEPENIYWKQQIKQNGAFPVPSHIRVAFEAQGAILAVDAALTTSETADEFILTSGLDQFQLRYSKADKPKPKPPLCHSEAQAKDNQLAPKHIWIVKTLTLEPAWSDYSQALMAAGADSSPLPPPSPSGAPYPMLISDPAGGDNLGGWVANYRNEPLDQRIQSDNSSAKTESTDPAYAYRSIKRENPALNKQPALGASIDPQKPNGFKYPKHALTPGMGDYDPYTPMMRAYAGDKVQVRTVVGAVDAVHSFGIQGVKWQAEPSYDESGWRDVQGYAISEHFEMDFDLPPVTQPGSTVDYLYAPSSSSAGQNKGVWGLVRVYSDKQADLTTLPQNPAGGVVNKDFYKPNPNKMRSYSVEVHLNANGKPTFTYKNCGGNSNCTKQQLILRANAGEWIELKLTNAAENAKVKLPACINGGGNSNMPNPSQTHCPKVGKKDEPPLPSTIAGGLKPYDGSVRIGFTPRLLAYDVATQSGMNVGDNKTDVTVAPGETRTYYWYAGTIMPDGKRVPVEFGGVNLVPADAMVQASYHVYGGLIIEPEGSHWQAAEAHNLTATITKADNSSFTEIVVLGTDKPGDTKVKAGSEVRLRILNPNAGNYLAQAGGSDDTSHVITVEGHNWQEEPFVDKSTRIGNNPLSQVMGTQQVTTVESYNLVLPSAGGIERVPGNYAYYYYPRGPEAKLGTITVFK